MTSTRDKSGQAAYTKVLLKQMNIVFKLFASVKYCIAWSQQLLHYKPSTSSSGTLDVIDQRTGNHYQLDISNNAIHAADIQAVNAGTGYDVSGRMNSGLRVLDPGFQNTAVMKSEITFV